jgi:hypothetical protein
MAVLAFSTEGSARTVNTACRTRWGTSLIRCFAKIELRSCALERIDRCGGRQAGLRGQRAILVLRCH